MGSVDRIVAIAGIALLVAAAAGLVITQESTLLDDYTYPTHDVALETRDAPVSGTTEFTWADLLGGMEGTPYGAHLTIEARFSGQAFAGGNAVIQAELVSPNGTTISTTEALAISPGATSAAHTFEMSLNWTQVPDNVRAIGDSLPEMPSYDEPLVLRLSIGAPPDALGAAADYNFAATVTGMSHVYTRAQI